MASRIPAYQQAQIEIKRYIAARKLGIGDALPPERVLAEQLGISRPSMREAVKALESLGILEARHGEGIFVRAFSFDTILENLPYSIVADGKSINELLQVRATLEIGVISQVADALSAQDRLRLREIAQRMLDAAGRGVRFEEEGLEFHSLLFRSLDNTLLLRLVDLFRGVFRRLNEAHHFTPDEWSLESHAVGHLRMVEMLDKGDKVALLQLYREYFMALGQRLQCFQIELPTAASDSDTLNRSGAHIAKVQDLDLNGRLDGQK
jgi:DNA-binding FadR family transcriptional regulator